MKFENQKYNSNRSFIDFMFILVCCLTLFFTLTLLRVIKENEALINKAEFIITLTWNDKSVNDIDLWLKSPDGTIVYYHEKEGSAVFLDRDDLGQSNDTILVGGKLIPILINQEIITIRGVIPGKWILVVHYYGKHDKKIANTEEAIKVRMDKLNPSVSIVFERDMVMDYVWQEKTIATFELLPDGKVVNVRFDEHIPMIESRISIPIDLVDRSHQYPGR